MAMVELDQMKFELQSYENTLHEVKDSLDLEGKRSVSKSWRWKWKHPASGTIRIPPTAR